MPLERENPRNPPGTSSGSATAEICPTKIAETVEQSRKYGFLRQPPCSSDPRPRRSICGKALNFRSSPKTSRGYAAEPPRESLAGRKVKQSFTANRTAEPLRSIKICPTQISETAEQASIYRVSDSLPKPARKQGRIKPRYLPKIWKTAKYTAKTPYFLILFFGFSLMSPLWGQGKPTAIKVDEFGRVGCEQLSARSDGFAQMIKKSPDSIGLAIVYPDSKYPHRSSAAEKQIVRSFYANGLNLSQIKVVRRDLKSDEMRVEFWQIPNGADEPEYFELGWPNAFRKPPKAYIFDCSFDDGVCNTFIPEIFVDFLKADPDLRGNIVIRGYSRTDRKNVGEEWITTFRKLGLPRSRLKVFYATAKNMSYAEFLIVPIKKN